jgi:hypothetical protein
MTTIGYAVLQIIPSLKGVSEAIEKQLTGKPIPVEIEPKFPDKGSAGRKKLDKAITDAVKKSPVQVPIEPKVDAKKAGDKIGKDITTGVQQSMSGAGGSGSVAGGIGKPIEDAIAKVDGKKAGTKIGKDVSAGVHEGVAGSGSVAGGISTGIEEGLAKADGKKAGAKVGKDFGESLHDGLSQTKDIGKTVGELVLPPLKQAAADYGKDLVTQIASGHGKEALDDLAGKARTVTDTIANAGKAIGVPLDWVRSSGNSAAGWVGGLGDAAQNLAGKIPNIETLATALAQAQAAVKGGNLSLKGGITLPGLKGGDLDRIKPLADSLGAGSELAQFQQVANDTKTQFDQIKGTFTDVLATLGTVGLVSPETAAGLAEAGGPLSTVAAPTLGGNWIANKIAPQLGQKERPWWWAIQQGFEMPGKWGSQILENLFGPSTAGAPFGTTPITPFQPSAALNEALLGGRPTTGPKVGDLGSYLGALQAPPAPQVVAAPATSGSAEVRANEAVVQTGPATISSATLNLAGVSLPSAPSPSPTSGTARPGFSSWFPTPSHPTTTSQMLLPGYDTGTNELPSDQIAQLHKGEVVVPADKVAAAGGAGNIYGALAMLGRQSQPSTPSALSGTGTFGLSDLTSIKTQVTPDSPERTFDIGSVVGSAIGGQASAALGAFGIPPPHWLQGIKQFVSGIRIGGGPGGGGPGFGVGAIPGLAGGAIPGAGGGAISAAIPSSLGAQIAGPAAIPGNLPGASGTAQFGPQTVFNIQTARVEDAFIQAQQLAHEKAAAKFEVKGG